MNGEHSNAPAPVSTDPVRHTKGPWRVGEMFHHGRVEILSADGWYVAQATGGIPIPEIEANARLIAAAPDLFDVVRDLAEYSGGMEYDDWRALVRRAETALVKIRLVKAESQS